MFAVYFLVELDKKKVKINKLLQEKIFEKNKKINGTKKVGKLQKHFRSKTHKAAPYTFYHFINKNNYIDKNKRKKRFMKNDIMLFTLM